MDSNDTLSAEITALEVELAELMPQSRLIDGRINEIRLRLPLARTLRLREIAMQKFGGDPALVEPWLKAMRLKTEIKQLQARLPGANHATAKQLQRRINELHHQLATMKVHDDE